MAGGASHNYEKRETNLASQGLTWEARKKLKFKMQKSKLLRQLADKIQKFRKLNLKDIPIEDARGGAEKGKFWSKQKMLRQITWKQLQKDF